MMAAVGCRLMGGFEDDPSVIPVAGTGDNIVLPGQVALANDLDTGLLAGVRGAVASGSAVGATVPCTGLKARLYHYSSGASAAITLPVDVTASGTFSFTVPAGSRDLFVRVFNSSETLVLLSVVSTPSAQTPIQVSERTTAVGFVVLSAAADGKLLMTSDVETQVSQNVLAGVIHLIAMGLKDPENGTRSIGENPLVTTVAGMVTGATAGTGTGTSTGSIWPASVLAGSSLSSPVLAALAGQYGQTSRASLNALSTADLAKAVQAAYAVGIDLSVMDAATIASDPVIQMAKRLGTPIVFENTAALAKYLAGTTGLPTGFPTGLPTADPEAAAAAMSAVLGLGVQSQVVVAVPSLTGLTQLYCLGVNPDSQVLSAGFLRGYDASGTPVVSTDTEKLGSSKTPPPVTGAAELLIAVREAIAGGIRLRSAPKTGIRAAVTQADTTKEFAIKWPQYVWYPNGKSQDFVIEPSIRVQLFQGNKDTDKQMRVIVQDGGGVGFLNRGALVWNEKTDRGYFMDYLMVKLAKSSSWVSIKGYSPTKDSEVGGTTPDAVNGNRLQSKTTLTGNNGSGYWSSEVTRDFQTGEFMCKMGEQGSEAVTWRWPMVRCMRPFSDDIEVIQPDDYPNRGRYVGMFYADPLYRVDRPLRMSRGTDQASFQPKPQMTFRVPTSETRTAGFTMTLTQEVWNVWKDSKGNFLCKAFSATLDRNFSVDFKNLQAFIPIWSTNTGGNPGARKVMQDDGNLVIVSSDGRVLWASDSYGNPGGRLVMQSDGNLVIYARKPIWATNTYGNPGARRVMQEDGNLVIYSQDGRPLWASNTSGNPGATLRMQDDGNLVVYSQDGRPLWASNTAGNPGATDVMQDDGNYVISGDKPVWASNTAGHPGAWDVMQEDGNYVIYAPN